MKTCEKLEISDGYSGFLLLLRGKRLAREVGVKRFSIAEVHNVGGVFEGRTVAESDSLHEMMVMTGAMGLESDRSYAMGDYGWARKNVRRQGELTVVEMGSSTWLSKKVIALRETGTDGDRR